MEQLIDTFKNFFRNSVISIPIVNLIIGIGLLDKYLCYLTVGLVLSGLFNLLIKQTLYISTTPQNRKFFLRPNTAKGCDACCNETPAADKIGFPSGHSQQAWFFTTYLLLYSYHKYKNINIISFLILIIFANAISISRLGWLGNQCHTYLQIITGGLLGSITSYYFFYLIN